VVTVAALLHAVSSAARQTGAIRKLSVGASLTVAVNTPIEGVKPRAHLASMKIK
jgi:hypothetical protein